jgi:hypothetical protein
LLVGIALLVGSAGWLTICLPRNEKRAWFVGVPFFDAGVPIAILTMFIVGAVLILAYFTTIDDLTLSGAVS